VVYGYRAPNGALTLYGAGEPTGNVATTPSIMVGTQLEAMALPTAGTVTGSWSVSYVEAGGATQAIIDEPMFNDYKIVAVDGSTATRQRVIDGRTETLRYNSPLSGLRSRDAGTFMGNSFPQIYQLPLAGMGATVSVNMQPFNRFGDSIQKFQYSISVLKP